MMKVTVLYSLPSDPDAFEAYYLPHHDPLARRIPGLLRLETARATGTPDGSPPPHYRSAELYFEDMAAVGAGFGSEEGKAAAKDAGELAARTGSTTTFVFSEVDPS
ncbi:MAG TPA: EthD family reductase [Mycobacteriales bacterium]|jgi:uncharacterized protein (TIGR02118 family)|nr:EthD family reductase [Mycobacteriales bacterium]